MSRYIDADYLIDTIGAMIGYGTTPTDIWDMIHDTPIIKTKEIKYYDESENVWKIGSVIIDENN